MTHNALSCDTVENGKRPLGDVGANAVRDGLQQAIALWQSKLGEPQVLHDRQRMARFQASTVGVRRNMLAVLRPQSTEDVQSLVRIANRFGIPLYPISTGRNWGYGSANPVVDGCVLVDLSQMNRILAFDAESGLTTIEPGVTQQQLWDFLQENGAPYFVPVHGGGPDCSLLGNALERGYGLTPYADHFAAVTSLEAVLPNGEVYRSALDALNGGEVNQSFKWGLGPYLDGLFTQSNLGIVTCGTISLAKTSQTAGFFFGVRSQDDLQAVVGAVRDILGSLGSLCSSINLMNSLRVLSMTEPYPAGQVPAGNAMPQEIVDQLARRNGVPCWTGVGALYGDKTMIRAARALIRRKIGSFVRPLIFLDQNKVATLDRLLGLIPIKAAQEYRRKLVTAREFLSIVAGKPERTALPLAYWKSGTQPAAGQPLDPARDGCGLIWYSPLVPMKSERVHQYIDHVNETCRRYGIDPLITLTSLSPHLFDSTVPVLFRQQDAAEAERAHACYDELFERGSKLGFVPYRVSVQHMDKVVVPEAPYWQMVAKIKQAVDPHDIIAPGRYCPTERRRSAEEKALKGP